MIDQARLALGHKLYRSIGCRSPDIRTTDLEHLRHPLLNRRKVWPFSVCACCDVLKSFASCCLQKPVQDLKRPLCDCGSVMTGSTSLG